MDFTAHNRLILPNVSGPSETLYLLRYKSWGHHALAFYRDGQLTEFTYGDWQLFALMQRDLYTSVKNMLIPTPGALGRKQVHWQKGQDMRPLFFELEKTLSFQVSAHKSQALWQKLNNAFIKGRNQQVLNARDQVYFVPYPVAYSLLNNCNHELVKWLAFLGCEVHGRIFWNPDLIKGVQNN